MFSFFIMQLSISSKTIPHGTRLKGGKTLPPDNHCVQKPSPRDKTVNQKPHPRDIKLENFTNVYEAKGMKFCTQVPRACVHKRLVLDFNLFA